MMSGMNSAVGVKGSAPGVTTRATKMMPTQIPFRRARRKREETMPSIPSRMIAIGNSKVAPKITISRVKKVR